MSGSPATTVLLPANQAAACNVGQRSCLAVAQRYVNVLALSSPSPRQKCRHDTIAGVKASCQVGNGYADLNGRSISRACNVHEAELSLDHNIVASAVGVRAGLAVSRNRSIDESGIDLSQTLIVHRILLQCAWEIVFDQDVAFRR